MGIFNPDSKFSQIMSRVFDLMIMNLIFIFTSIPIFTIGVNYTALYYVTLKMVKNEESYVFKSYWKSWRQNFKQATGIWLIFLFIGVFLVMDIFLVNQMTGPSTYLRYVFFVILFIWGMVLTYVFPVLSRFDNTVKQTIKNSLLMSIRHLPWTIVMLEIIPAATDPSDLCSDDSGVSGVLRDDLPGDRGGCICKFLVLCEQDLSILYAV